LFLKAMTCTRRALSIGFISKPLSSFVLFVFSFFHGLMMCCWTQGQRAREADPVGCVLIRRQQRQDMSSSCNGLGSLLSGSLMSTKSH
jgi:hypothetical protein